MVSVTCTSRFTRLSQNFVFTLILSYGTFPVIQLDEIKPRDASCVTNRASDRWLQQRRQPWKRKGGRTKSYGTCECKDVCVCLATLACVCVYVHVIRRGARRARHWQTEKYSGHTPGAPGLVRAATPSLFDIHFVLSVVRYSMCRRRCGRVALRAAPACQGCDGDGDADAHNNHFRDARRPLMRRHRFERKLNGFSFCVMLSTRDWRRRFDVSSISPFSGEKGPRVVWRRAIRVWEEISRTWTRSSPALSSLSRKNVKLASYRRKCCLGGTTFTKSKVLQLNSLEVNRTFYINKQSHISLYDNSKVDHSRFNLHLIPNSTICARKPFFIMNSTQTLYPTVVSIFS